MAKKKEYPDDMELLQVRNLIWKEIDRREDVEIIGGGIRLDIPVGVADLSLVYHGLKYKVTVEHIIG